MKRLPGVATEIALHVLAHAGGQRGKLCAARRISLLSCAIVLFEQAILGGLYARRRQEERRDRRGGRHSTISPWPTWVIAEPREPT